jgi:hypothetical protein
MKLPHPKAAEDVNEPLLQEVDYHIINWDVLTNWSIDTCTVATVKFECRHW